jgi:predicted nucleotidyltransferase
MPSEHCAAGCVGQVAAGRSPATPIPAAPSERRTILGMAVLAHAALDEREREVLDRLVRALVEEYGDDLDGVWLYGSRARGERPHDESDVDVLVVMRSDRDDRALIPLLWRVLDELGNPRVLVDPRQRSRA